MVKQLLIKENDTLKRISSFPWLFPILWIAPIIMTVLTTDISLLEILYAVSSVLLILHIIYGGYFLISKQQVTKSFSLITALIIWCSLFLLPMSVDDPTRWFSSAIFILVIAMVFHSTLIMVNHNPGVRKFCKGKLLVEVLGILLLLIGYFMTARLGSSISVGIVNIFCISALDYIIFFKSSLYKHAEF